MATKSLASILSASNAEVVREQRRQTELPSGTFKATLCGVKEESFRGREGHHVPYQRVTFRVGTATYSVSLGRLWFKVKGGREQIAAVLSAGHEVTVKMTSFKDDRTGRLGYDVDCA